MASSASDLSTLLDRAWQDTTMQWTDTRSQWRDAKGSSFANTYWPTLEAEVLQFVSALEELASAIEESQRQFPS